MIDNKILSDEEINNIINVEYFYKNDKDKSCIRRCLKRWGKKYSYHKLHLVSYKDKSNKIRWNKVIVTCPFHGDFEIDSEYFVSNPICKGCTICYPNKTARKSLDKFLNEVKKIYPYYSEIPGKTVYLGNSVKIWLHCDLHNVDFEVRPGNLLVQKKTGCKMCELEKRRNSRLKSAEQNLIREIEEYSPGKYDFSKVDYTGQSEKIILINLKYNEEFEIAPVVIKQYIRGKEPLSPSERKIFLFRKRLTSKELEDIETLRKEFPLKDDITLFFIKRAREVSLIPIDYSKTEYKTNSTYVELRCITHDKVYFQRLHNLLSGDCGCPDCKINSKGEGLVDKWLNYANLKFTTQYCPETVSGRNKDSKVYIDFKVIYNGIEYWIEYNGEQHYSNIHFFDRTYDNFLEQVERDENVRNYCRLNNIVLVEIPYLYSDYSSISDILERVIIRGEDPLDIINLPKINKNENSRKFY